MHDAVRYRCMSYSRALLADDDPVYRMMAEEFLYEAGLSEIETAEDGEAALSLLDAAPGRFDLVLSDLNMPTRDGVGLLRGLVERRFSGALLICSGEAPAVLDASVRLARIQGLRIIGAIPKPLRLEALISALSAPPPVLASVSPSRGPTAELLDAVISEGGALPFFQPKVCFKTGRIEGAEALLRISLRGETYSNPVPFIELAETTGRIDALTFSLVRRVFTEAAGWKAAGLIPHLAINISPRSLENIDFPDRIAGEVKAFGLSPSDFTLEITETQVAAISATALDVMTRLRIKGFGLSVDDFGTGFSNIDRLRHFPFTELKIDKSFVMSFLEDTFSRVCVETAVLLARELGMKVVAEGVETEEIYSVLRQLGVDLAQGWLLSRAVPPDSFSELLRDPFRLRPDGAADRSAVA